MPQNVVIINLGMGNLFSVKKKIDSLNIHSTISSNPSEINKADKIILPGVGHFEKAMKNLNETGLLNAINENVLVKKKPILGICLGMQIMALSSEEGNCKGLGWLNADVIKFKISNPTKYKIPHIGWNRVQITKKSKLMTNITSGDEFYFVHAYHFKCNDQSDVLATSEYEYPFSSAVEKENIFGVQFHPEKSHDTGTKLLENFINI